MQLRDFQVNVHSSYLRINESNFGYINILKEACANLELRDNPENVYTVEFSVNGFILVQKNL